MTDEEFAAIKPHNRDATYGPAFFKFCELDHGWSSSLFGEVVHLIFRPRSVVEFGCGTGATLAALRQRGVDVLGLDASAACIPFVKRHDPDVPVIVHDLAVPWRSERQFDLAISIETLEHVTPEGADSAVATIAAAAPIAVVTACPPVGRNPLHLNEQPFTYWIEKFKAVGFDRDAVATDAVRGVMRSFEALHTAKRCPVVPCWYTSGYIGVFRKA